MVLLVVNPLNFGWATEAHTLSVNASFNNQRLETLGAAFSKLETLLRLFNKICD